MEVSRLIEKGMAMADSSEDVLNLESATAEELGRLISSQPQDAEVAPNLARGTKRAQLQARELLSQDLDLPGFGSTRPK